MKKLAIVFIISIFIGTNLQAHCQVPCGIYNDAMRIIMLKENVKTIEKAMNQIKTLSAQLNGKALNTNQMVRWVNTKESHAGDIQEIVTAYFLTQRIKPKEKKAKEYKKYVDQTVVLQQILVSAMKCKQTVDPAHTAKTLELIDQFVQTYFDQHGLDHIKTLEKG